MINISHVYEGDYKDGSLDLLILESDLPELVLIGKIISEKGIHFDSHLDIKNIKKFDHFS